MTTECGDHNELIAGFHLRFSFVLSMSFKLVRLLLVSHLDPGATIPAATGVGSVVDRGSPLLVDEPDANQGAHDPEDCAQERECLGSLHSIAESSLHDAAPMPDASTTKVVVRIDQQAKSCEPCCSNDEVHWIVDETTCERQEPEQGQEDGDTSDDFGVDEASMGPVVVGVVVGVVQVMEVFPYETCDDTCKGELADAQRDGNQAGCDRHGGWWLMDLLSLKSKVKVAEMRF